MMEQANQGATAQHHPSDRVMIELLYKFSLLMEAQLVDLQQSVRKFVEEMNLAIMNLDNQVSEEGKQAQQIYESIYSESEGEAQVLNDRAASRVDDILAELLGEAGTDSGVSDDLKNSFSGDAAKAVAVATQEARDDVWAKISKKLESITRLEERLRPQVFKIVTCLNFEDIQSQRLNHILDSHKMLNEGLMRQLQSQSFQEKEALVFVQEFLKKVRGMYTMEEERRIFDSIFSRTKN